MKLNELRELATRVSELYEAKGAEFANFQKSSALYCLPGCGDCCNHPEVSASVVEMLPAALSLLERGEALNLFKELEDISTHKSCIFYKPTSPDKKLGRCGEYLNRAVICRSFGACALKNKDGKKILSLCHLIKESTSVDLANISLEDAPQIDEFARSVRYLDSDANIYPINLALKIALEKVLMAANYENEYYKL